MKSLSVGMSKRYFKGIIGNCKYVVPASLHFLSTYIKGHFMIGTIFSIIGAFFSLIGISVSHIGKSSAAKFQSFKDKGVDIKESKKQLGKALLLYKKALDYAETDEQKTEIWGLIMHIHTDRLIGASQKWKNCTGQTPLWDFGPNKIPSNYNPPPTQELLR